MTSDSPWTTLARQLGFKTEDVLESISSLWRQKLHPEIELHVIAYRGYGNLTPEGGWKGILRGRVLRYKDKPEPGASELWSNLRASYARFDTDEVPGVVVRGQIDSLQAEAVTDEEGYFTLQFSCAEPTADFSVALCGVSPDNSSGSLSGSSSDEPAFEPPIESSAKPGITQNYLSVEITLPNYSNLKVDGDPFINLPDKQARFGVISDIDDTLLVTQATSVQHMMRLTLLESAATRLAFDGVAEFYHALHDERNPFFYVSSSPWNLYEFLTDFMRLNKIVPGPLLLRDFGIDETKFIAGEHKEHKLRQIRAVLNQCPDLSFILLGDSGQDDPEIYATICNEFPSRIKSIYIRDVSDQWRRQSVRRLIEQLQKKGISMLLVPDTDAAATHAAARGFIAQDKLPGVHEAIHKAHLSETSQAQAESEPPAAHAVSTST